MRPSAVSLAGVWKPTPMCSSCRERPALDDISKVNARFPPVQNTDVLCGTFEAAKIIPSKLSKLLPGVQLKENPLLHQNIQIKEPRNWMGVSISDLGRGYAWSDYIQLVGAVWGRRA